MFGSARTQPGQDLLLNAPAFCVNKLHIFCHLPSATAAVDDAVGLPLTYRSRLTDADSHCFHSLEGGRGGEGTWQSSFGEVVCMLSGPGEWVTGVNKRFHCNVDGLDGHNLHLSECWRMFLPLLHLCAAAVDIMDTLVFRHLLRRPAFFHSYWEAGFGLPSPHRVPKPPGKSWAALQIHNRSPKSRPVASLNQSQTQLTQPVTTGLGMQHAPV